MTITPIVDTIYYLISIRQVKRALDLMELLSPTKDTQQIQELATLIARQNQPKSLEDRLFALLSHRVHRKFRKQLLENYVISLLAHERQLRAVSILQNLDVAHARRLYKKLMRFLPHVPNSKYYRGREVGASGMKKFARSVPEELRREYLGLLKLQIVTETHGLYKLWRYFEFLSHEYRGHAVTEQEKRVLAKKRLASLAEWCTSRNAYTVALHEIECYRAYSWFSQDNLAQQLSDALTKLKVTHPELTKNWKVLQLYWPKNSKVQL